MKIPQNLRFLALLGLFSMAACDETTDLAFDDLTPAQQLELAVLSDQASFDIASDLTTLTNDVAMARGHGGTIQARGLNAEARGAFAEARAAWLAGDHQRALELSDIARRLVARSLIATGGVPAVEDLIERLEAILLTMDDDVVDDTTALQSELETIIAEAQALLDAGDSVGAAAQAILGEQRARFRRGKRDHRGDIDEDRAQLAVDLATTALSLAEGLIDEQVLPTDLAVSDVADRQNRWLATAAKMLEKAEAALANGRFARAVHFAQHAQWSALKAVILPGGILEEEVRAMVDLATDLLVDAEAALGNAPSMLELRLFEHAGDLLEKGISGLEEGHKRGVAPVWRSAVISSLIIG
jgi:HEPN domain-containing protein